VVNPEKNIMRTTIFFVLMTTLVLTGCGDPRVAGTVKYQDGSPLTTGMLVLQNEKSQGIGELQPDGSFELYQFKKGDGLKPGTYKGYILNAYVIDENLRTTYLIPTKYSTIDESGIIYDSNKDKGKLDIIIDANPPAR
jgi:hypothetical protein